MKKRICTILSVILCSYVLSSPFYPVSAQESSAHAGCEHETPPYFVEVQEEGYGWDSSYHWRNYVTLVKCSRCHIVMEVAGHRE